MKKYRTVVVIVIFILLWYFLNGKNISTNGLFSNDKLAEYFSCNSSHGGYHYFITLAIGYTAIFLCYLMSYISEINILKLIKYRRNKYIKLIFKELCVRTITFTGIFCAINVLANILLFKLEILISCKFIIMEFIYLIDLILYFMVMGSICIFIWIITGFSSSSVWITVVVSSAILEIYILSGWNILLFNTEILDGFCEGIVNITAIITVWVKNIIIFCILRSISIENFIRRDFLARKEI
ncbi:hypothetical protein [Eubacterium sp.]|uniref:hypothetical protein n=1 Tax=Eubacterium sp. TaxID=142586 RepID=UPI002673A8DD|nr:hypothetical protein [uncultured Eubacterium sp.]